MDFAFFHQEKATEFVQHSPPRETYALPPRRKNQQQILSPPLPLSCLYQYLALEELLILPPHQKEAAGGSAEIRAIPPYTWGSIFGCFLHFHGPTIQPAANRNAR
jgi:hypothetical protein